ncbi:MAG: hypothetical protein J0H68_08645 [Sphingobacteriia bacterium]|nr:hypothetical protein [Sphingobacteriia bacterium]
MLRALINLLLLFFLFIKTSIAYNIKYNGSEYHLRYIFLKDRYVIDNFTITSLDVTDEIINFEGLKSGLLYINNNNFSIQEELICSGKAIFYPDKFTSEKIIKKLGDCEKQAIKNNLGFWQNNFKIYNYKDQLPEYNFIIYEGYVKNIFNDNDFIKLNLDNKRLYLKVSKEIWKKFLQSYKKDDILSKKISVKGWVTKNKIPYIVPLNQFMINIVE